jgi:hypothetical protein
MLAPVTQDGPFSPICKAETGAVNAAIALAILRVLSAHPQGRASVDALKADLAMLASKEWFERMQALASRTGPVNLFSAGLVTRDSSGWSITDAGRRYLADVEASGAGLPE